MSIDLSRLEHDRDVVEPFVQRLLERLRVIHPNITLADITLSIDVLVSTENPFGALPAANRIRRMLRDMDKEGVVL